MDIRRHRGALVDCLPGSRMRLGAVGSPRGMDNRGVSPATRCGVAMGDYDLEDCACYSGRLDAAESLERAPPGIAKEIFQGWLRFPSRATRLGSDEHRTRWANEARPPVSITKGRANCGSRVKGRGVSTVVLPRDCHWAGAASHLGLTASSSLPAPRSTPTSPPAAHWRS